MEKFFQNKTLPQNLKERNKESCAQDSRVAGIEIVVEPVVVPVPLIAVPVEVTDVQVAIRVANVYHASCITTLRILSGLNFIRYQKYHSTIHQVSSFFESSYLTDRQAGLHTSLYLNPYMTNTNTLDAWILDSVARICQQANIRIFTYYLFYYSKKENTCTESYRC